MIDRSAWWRDAACRGRPLGWWYPRAGDSFTVAVARRVCVRCAVRGECLASALVEEASATDVHGIRGGLTAGERRELLAGRQARAVAVTVERRVVPSAGWPSYRLAVQLPLESWTPGELAAARASTSA